MTPREILNCGGNFEWKRKGPNMSCMRKRTEICDSVALLTHTAHGLGGSIGSTATKATQNTKAAQQPTRPNSVKRTRETLFFQGVWPGIIWFVGSVVCVTASLPAFLGVVSEHMEVFSSSHGSRHCLVVKIVLSTDATNELVDTVGCTRCVFGARSTLFVSCV